MIMIFMTFLYEIHDIAKSKDLFFSLFLSRIQDPLSQPSRIRAQTTRDNRTKTKLRTRPATPPLSLIRYTTDIGYNLLFKIDAIVLRFVNEH